MPDTTSYKTITIQQDTHVTTLWLDRPETRNALSSDMLSELNDFFTRFHKDPGSRVLVLRGRGSHFCSGADLNDMKTGSKTKNDLIMEADLFYDVFDLLFRFPVPVVCVVHGSVFGGGNGLVASSDICLATDDCRFAFSEVRLGLVPATISPFVIRRIGEFNARRMFFTGMVFDSQQALGINLVDEVIQESLIDKKISEITGLITQAGPEAVKRTKKLLIDVMDGPGKRELRSMVTRVIAEARDSKEAIEGISAFFEKRKPGWR